MGVLMKNGVNYSGGLIEVKPEIYSEEEREIGVWTDGKPLYQKTFSGTFSVTSTSRTWYSIYSVSDLSSLNIDKCMFIRGLYKEPTISFYIDMGIMKGNDGIYCSMVYNPSEGIKFVVCNGATGTGEFIFTIQYTKTTDVAGSGLWSTTGAPAHHYSQNEQIVGTWIDGKPLYEKTIIYDNQTTIGDGYTSFASLSAIDHIDIISGGIINSSDDSYYPIPYVFGNKSTSWYYDVGDLGIRVANDTWSSDWDIFVTIRYTKTTD